MGPPLRIAGVIQIYLNGFQRPGPILFGSPAGRWKVVFNIKIIKSVNKYLTFPSPCGTLESSFSDRQTWKRPQGLSNVKFTRTSNIVLIRLLFFDVSKSASADPEIIGASCWKVVFYLTGVKRPRFTKTKK